RLVELELDPQLAEQLAQVRARFEPAGPPAETLGAMGVGGAALELAQVRDHAAGVDRALARRAHPAGARWSACARQWAPPPPIVNAERSGSSTSSPCARIASLSRSE